MDESQRFKGLLPAVKFGHHPLTVFVDLNLMIMTLPTPLAIITAKYLSHFRQAPEIGWWAAECYCF